MARVARSIPYLLGLCLSFALLSGATSLSEHFRRLQDVPTDGSENAVAVPDHTGEFDDGTSVESLMSDVDLLEDNLMSYGANAGGVLFEDIIQAALADKDYENVYDEDSDISKTEDTVEGEKEILGQIKSAETILLAAKLPAAMKVDIKLAIKTLLKLAVFGLKTKLKLTIVKLLEVISITLMKLKALKLAPKVLGISALYVITVGAGKVGGALLGLAKMAAVAAKDAAIAAKDAAIAAKDATVGAKEDAVGAKKTAVAAKKASVMAKEFAADAKKAIGIAKAEFEAEKNVSASITKTVS